MYIPNLITSDVLPLAGLSAVLDARHLPFAPASLRAIVMTNVLHHIPHPRLFFSEASRCVRPGGAVVMIEPWRSPWSALIYTHLHHEPFVPDAPEWEFASTGSLSGANGALPWILFYRDRAEFEKEFPEWRLAALRPGMPFRYLLSGGMTFPSLMPGWSFPFWRWVEQRLSRWSAYVSMFAAIVLQRTALGSSVTV